MLKDKFPKLVQRIINGTIWSMVGTFVSKFLAFASTVIIARMMTKDAYGQLGIIRSTIVMLAGIAGCGIGAAATKFIAQYKKENPEKALRLYLVINSFIITLSIISCVGLLAASNWLAIARFNDPTMAASIRVAAIILFFTLLNVAQTGTLAGFEDFRHIASVNIIMGITQIVFIVLGTKLFGLTGAIIGFGISYATAYLVSGFFIIGHLKNMGFDIKKTIKNLTKSDFKVLWDFCLPLAATSWISMIVYWWMKTVIVHDAGFSDMANYDVAEQWKTIMLVIPGIIANVILPIMSSFTGNTDKQSEVFYLNIKINICVSLVFCFIIIFCRNLLLSLYGVEYNNALPLCVLCLSAVFDSVSNTFGTLLMSTDNVKYGLITNTIWAMTLWLSFVLLSQLLVANLENILSWAYLIAAIIQSLSLAIMAKKKKMISMA